MDMNVHKFLRMIPLTEEQKNRLLLCFLLSIFYLTQNTQNNEITHALRWCWLASRDVLVARRNTQNTQTFADCSAPAGTHR